MVMCCMVLKRIIFCKGVFKRLSICSPSKTVDWIQSICTRRYIPIPRHIPILLKNRNVSLDNHNSSFLTQCSAYFVFFCPEIRDLVCWVDGIVAKLASAFCFLLSAFCVLFLVCSVAHQMKGVMSTLTTAKIPSFISQSTTEKEKVFSPGITS